MLNGGLGNSFQPCLINECEDIKLSLNQIASKYKTDVSMLDFELKDISTYKKNNYSDEIELISSNMVDNFFCDRDNILDTRYTFLQRYTIEVSLKQHKSKNQFSFRTDPVFSQSYLIFHKNFILNDFDHIYSEIKRIKLLNKILIIKEKEEKKALEEFLSSLSYPLEEEVKYILLSGFNLIPTTNGDIKYKISKDSIGDFHTLSANDLICVYKKPFQGKPGRNIKGEYIIPDAPNITNEHCPLIRYDDKTIKVVEYPYETHYLAALGGILNFKDDYFWIDTTLETKEISFKTTGDLIGDIDSGTTINITESDNLKEALGQGTKLQASKINIQGNVASGASIKAREVNIGGFTHKDSVVNATNINIATHKGLAIGDIIKIDMLEAGIVKGRVVEINEVYGGKIYADEIIVNTLHSNAFFYATNKIEVSHMVKGENKFFISAFYSPTKEEAYNTLLKQRNDALYESRALIKELKIKNLELKKLEDVAKDTRAILVECKNTHKKPPVYLLHKFEEYHNMVVHLKELKNRLEELDKLYKMLNSELLKRERDLDSSYIHIHSGWVGYNEVRYVLHFPESRELMLIPKPSQPKKVVYNSAIKELHLID